MRLNIGLTTVGAACAVLTVVGFVVGIALKASSASRCSFPRRERRGSTGSQTCALVTISHATPIALALDLAPRVNEATGASKESLEATFDTFARFCLLMNSFGDIMIWGVTTPLFAFAILKTKVAPKWVGWVGLVAAIFAGWLGLLTPVSSFFDGLSTIGFFAFFIFTASLGVVLLRRRETIEAQALTV